MSGIIEHQRLTSFMHGGSPSAANAARPPPSIPTITTAATTSVRMSAPGPRRRDAVKSEGLVDRVDERDRARVEQDVRPHPVHHVAEADARVGIGEAERSARAGMPEDARTLADARVGTVLRQHVSVPEAG